MFLIQFHTNSEFILPSSIETYRNHSYGRKYMVKVFDVQRPVNLNTPIELSKANLKFEYGKDVLQEFRTGLDFKLVGRTNLPSVLKTLAKKSWKNIVDKSFLNNEHTITEGVDFVEYPEWYMSMKKTNTIFIMGGNRRANCGTVVVESYNDDEITLVGGSKLKFDKTRKNNMINRSCSWATPTYKFTYTFANMTREATNETQDDYGNYPYANLYPDTLEGRREGWSHDRSQFRNEENVEIPWDVESTIKESRKFWDDNEENTIHGMYVEYDGTRGFLSFENQLDCNPYFIPENQFQRRWEGFDQDGNPSFNTCHDVDRITDVSKINIIKGQVPEMFSRVLGYGSPAKMMEASSKIILKSDYYLIPSLQDGKITIWIKDDFYGLAPVYIRNKPSKGIPCISRYHKSLDGYPTSAGALLALIMHDHGTLVAVKESIRILVNTVGKVAE